MKIGDFLKKEGIMLDLKASDKQEASKSRQIWDIIWRFINFFILVFVLVKYARKPLMGFLHGHSQEIGRASCRERV